MLARHEQATFVSSSESKVKGGPGVSQTSDHRREVGAAVVRGNDNFAAAQFYLRRRAAARRRRSSS